MRIDPASGIQAMTEPVIEAVDVVKFLGEGAGRVQALKGVSLSLACGQLTLLMGPSGSGKTTLLSVLGCMLTPTSGNGPYPRPVHGGRAARSLGQTQARPYRVYLSVLSSVSDAERAVDNVRLALDVRGERAEQRDRQGEGSAADRRSVAQGECVSAANSAAASNSASRSRARSSEMRRQSSRTSRPARWTARTVTPS